MATWQVTIKVDNVAERRVQVTGVRTDGEDVRSYSARAQVQAGDVQASLRAVMDTLFANHTAAVAAETSQAALIDGWEASAATYLDGLEE